MNRCSRRQPRPPVPLAILALAVAGGALALSAPAAGAAPGGIPDPSYSVADTCLVLSPAGAFDYTVILRDESFAPIAGATVVLDFAPAPGIVLCSAADPDGDRRVTETTDAEGRAVLRVRGGGQSTGHVVVSAVAQALRQVYPRSTDLDGDLVVTQQDVTLHVALPPAARAGDYDCDGDSDAADRQRVQDQVGHDCQTVAVLSSTWGRVKAVYR